MILDDALRYMGVQKPTPEDIEAVQEAVRQVEHAMLCSFLVREDYVKNLSNILCGEDIQGHLKGCVSAYVFLATLGTGVDRLIKKTQIKSMSLALAVDAAASAVLEDYCDKICAELAQKKKITSRFSPGYGDYAIEVQPRLLKAIDAYKIGVSCTGGFMMVPTKSVSAIIGIKGEKA